MNDVLIVDDEEDIHDALRRVLERAGYRVRAAENGADGLTQMQQRAADIGPTPSPPRRIWQRPTRPMPISS